MMNKATGLHQKEHLTKIPEEKMKKPILLLIGVIIIFLLAACPGPNDPASTTYRVTISPSGSAAGESVRADVSDAAAGAAVTLTASLGGGRQVVLSAAGITITPSTVKSNGGTATFTMPAQATEVSAVFSNAYSAGSTVTRTANTVSFNMHFVPSGGPFTMGEHVVSPTQSVTLTKNFWMGETEVTQGLWEDVWGGWPGNDPADHDYGAGDNHPAYFVNWYDSAALCNLLTLADSSIADTQRVYYSDEGLTTAYTKANAANSIPVFIDWSKTGYRLPTEAEWEYAARYIDGTSWNNGDHVSGDTEYACFGTASGSPLATNERISEYAWWSGNNGGATQGSKPVGQKTANALELYDMSGNINEWCHDYYTSYSGGSETDPIGPENGTNRTYRGGIWYGSSDGLRCAVRSSDSPTSRGNGLVGLRLCRTAE